MSDHSEAKQDDTQPETNTPSECFVIMPISDQPGYDAGHFTRVFEDIIKPACRMAGVSPVRADDNQQTDIIHFEIVKKIVHCPLAICDLSARNPNVMFELGIRQAFDKPVVLIQETGAARIFDVNLLRTVEYRRQRIYHEVLEDQAKIRDALLATKSGSSINSIIRLLALEQPATVPDYSEATRDNPALQLVMNELGSMRQSIADLHTLVILEQAPLLRAQPLSPLSHERIKELKAIHLGSWLQKIHDNPTSHGLSSAIIDVLEEEGLILRRQPGETAAALLPLGRQTLIAWFAVMGNAE